MKKLLLQTSSMALLLLVVLENPLWAHSRSTSALSITEQAEISLTGRVVSAAGEPLPAVTVLLKGIQAGTTTLADGAFQLQVRARAGLTNDLAGMDKAALAILIAKERQAEFCFENQRYYDLKRTGQALAVLAAHGAREKVKKTFL